MKCRALICLTVGLMFAGVAGASEIKMQDRGYTHSCGYFSSSEADFSVTYRNDELPWGTRVFLIYGFGGYRYEWNQNGSYRAPFEWVDRTEVEANAVSPYTWGVAFSKMIRGRSENRFIDAIQLVVRVQLPDGRELFENGSGSRWGFWESKFYFSDSSTCVDEEHPKPEMRDAVLSPVVRN